VVKKEHAIAVVAIVIVVLGVFLLSEFGGVTVGKAFAGPLSLTTYKSWFISGTATEGGKWIPAAGQKITECQTMVSGKLTNLDAKKNPWDQVPVKLVGNDGVVGKKSGENVCCPKSVDVCSSELKDGGGIVKAWGCFSENSVIRQSVTKDTSKPPFTYLCANTGKELAWFECGKSKLLSSIINDKFFCDNTQWNVCDSKLDGMTPTDKDKKLPLEGDAYCKSNKWTTCGDAAKGGSDMFCNTKTKNSWHKCTKPGTSVGNALCLANKKWAVCDKAGKVSEDKKFACEESAVAMKWLECKSDMFQFLANKDVLDKKTYCAGTLGWQKCDAKTGGDFCDASNGWLFEKKDQTNDFDSVGIYKDLKLVTNFLAATDKTDKAKDIKTERKVVYALLEENKPQYFKYDGKTIKLELVKPNVVVTELATQTEQKLLMEQDTTHKLQSKQKQLELKLNNDAAAYLQLLAGTFHGYTGEYGKSFVVVAVSPKLDFDGMKDNDKAYSLLLSEAKQKFTYAGEHDVHTFSPNDANSLLYVKGKEFSSNGLHYLDAKKTQKVTFNFLKKWRNLAAFEFSKTKGAAVFVSPITHVNLTEEYEALFGINSFVNVSNIKDGKNLIGVGMVGVCEVSKKIAHILEVCDKTKEIFSLEDGIIHVEKAKKASSDGKSHVLNDEGEEVALFLFKKGTKREANAYHLIDLEEKDNQGVILTKTEADLSIHLASGRSVALKAHNNYYLLSLDGKEFDLTKLKLKQLRKVKENIEVEYKPAGDQDKVEFHLPLGKQIEIKLNKGAEVKIDLKASEFVEKKINIKTVFEGGINTYADVEVSGLDEKVKDNVTPVTKKIMVAKDDIKTFANILRMDIGGKVSELSLPAKDKEPVPTEYLNSIIYYKEFTPGDKANTFAKYANIHLHEKLDDNDKKTPFILDFTDEKFILPLAKGNRIALSLEGKYYLLGYKEKWTGSVSFDAGKMQLTDLLGKNPVAITQIDGKTYQFVLKDNRIEIAIDTDKKKIQFSGVTKTAVKGEITKSKQNGTVLTGATYSHTLWPDNDKWDYTTYLGKKDDSIGQYTQCDSVDTKAFPDKVLLCIKRKSKEEQKFVTKDEPYEDNGFLIWFRGKNSKGEKEVKFQNILPDFLKSSSETFKWQNLLKEFAVNKNPIFKWQEKYFQFTGGNTLSTFKIQTVPFGKHYPVQMQSTESGEKSGTIVMDEHMLLLQQTLKDSQGKTTKEITLTVEERKDKLVSSTKFNMTKQTEFVTGINAESYILSPTQNNNLIKLQLLHEKTVAGKQQKDLLSEISLPVGASTKLLLLDGEVVTIKIEETADGKMDLDGKKHQNIISIKK